MVHGEKTTSNLSLHPSRTVAGCDGFVVEVSGFFFLSLEPTQWRLFFFFLSSFSGISCTFLDTCTLYEFSVWDYSLHRQRVSVKGRF